MQVSYGTACGAHGVTRPTSYRFKNFATASVRVRTWSFS